MENDDTRVEEYEELLLKRDQIFRESGSILTAYTKEFAKDETLRELWEQIYEAYQRTDVDALEDLGDESFELNLVDIEERIERVENPCGFYYMGRLSLTYGKVLK